MNYKYYDYVTKGRLNKMLKYFKNKKIKLKYKYNNSLGMYHEREYKGIFDSFEIDQYVYSNCKSFTIKLFKKDKLVYEEDFDSCAEFTGLGSIRENNSGPYCYFDIRRI